MRLAVAALLIACDLGAAPAAGQTSDVVSLDRVRAALDKPASHVLLTRRTPDFTVHIETRRPLQEIFDAPPWAMLPEWRPHHSTPPSPFGSQPLVSVDLLAIASGLVNEVRSIRRAHAEGAARAEVSQAIRDYCAAQPNGGAGIQICDKPPASR